MATIQGVKAKIQSVIDLINNKTGKFDTNLTTAIDSLISSGELQTLFEPIVTISSSENFDNDTVTVENNADNGAFPVSLELKVNGETVSNPHTVTGIYEYLIEAVARAKGFSESKITKTVYIGSKGLNYKYYTFGNSPETYTGVDKGTCTAEDVYILPEFDGRPVDRIVQNGFASCTTVKRIFIPSSITRFVSGAFSGALNLEEIHIPESVTYIGEYCFNRCDCLTELQFPSGITRLYNNTVYNCAAIRTIDFSKHKQVPIGSTFPFQSNPNLTEIRVPSALYDEWISATNWVRYVDLIVPV